MNKKLTFYLLIFSLILNFTISNVLASEEIQIESTAAILIDATSGTVLFEKDGYGKHYPASITKLLTSLLVMETLSPDDIITHSHNAVNSLPPGSSSIGMRRDEQLTVDQALHGLLLMSANEIANAFAEEISGSIENFSKQMTTRAKELGALNSNFVNPHGLHDDNHYTTAYDMAIITRELVTHQYFRNIMKNITYQIPETNVVSEIRYLAQRHPFMNHIRDVASYREEVIGGKTGYTIPAGHTLVTIAEKNDLTLIVVILGSDNNKRYSDTNKLIDYGFNNFKQVKLIPPDLMETLAIVEHSDNASTDLGSSVVSVNTFSPFYVLAPISEAEIVTKMELPEYLSKDVAIGDKVGTFSYYQNDRFLASIDLVIEDVNLLVLEKASAIKASLDWKRLLAFLVVAIFLLLIAIRSKFKRNRLYYYRRSRRTRYFN
ncbi:D-alanyl-D-alanine carboxypeptidase (penicillin-binding protein 5/6) [Natranaerovirga pectinivora]|uniref:D-alanyl-D-alanine carboxypeptidase (Penicillin-binding protein 5/6) n=1 Tax=Natranaerovirga pectinivora TaxID=682400 RepID=A0A4R3MKA7_9FIRM|nr:D-alanyl-D-alanine carboxypeptidase family protein [Natranaerovirga pectinivora]TCT14997.1 D-alanyl-D-alanine carboxypeptidase (penicillin-binding protein 5/6) [Natranaerovirga pectinivora]